MKYKNRKGSTLVLVVIVFSIMMIYATFMLSFIVTENKQAIWHENYTKAYYLARSGALGVETAIRSDKIDIRKLTIGEVVDLEFPKTANEGLVKNGKLLIENDESIRVKLKIVSQDEISILEIDSRGKINGVENNVVKQLLFSGDDSPITEDVIIQYTIYSKTGINLRGNKIGGIVASGDRVTGAGQAEKTEENVKDSYEILAFPELNESYKKEKNSEVDLENKTRDYIYIDNASKDDVKIESKNSSIGDIYITGKYKKVEITLEKSNIRGDIYIYSDNKNAEIIIELEKKSSITGNIYTNVKKLKIEGKDDKKEQGIINGLIYGPETDIIFKDYITVNGIIVGNSINLKDLKEGSIINYDPKTMPGTTSSSNTTSGASIKFESYFK